MDHRARRGQRTVDLAVAHRLGRRPRGPAGLQAVGVDVEVAHPGQLLRRQRIETPDGEVRLGKAPGTDGWTL